MEVPLERTDRAISLKMAYHQRTLKEPSKTIHQRRERLIARIRDQKSINSDQSLREEPLAKT